MTSAKIYAISQRVESEKRIEEIKIELEQISTRRKGLLTELGQLRSESCPKKTFGSPTALPHTTPEDRVRLFLELFRCRKDFCVLKKKLKMKKVFIITIVIVGAAAFLFVKRVQRESQSLDSLCQSYTVGQKIDVNTEMQRIESLSLHVTSTITNQDGTDVLSILISDSGFEPAICEVQVQDGSILSIN